jgi:hypothetical protein
VWQVERRAPSQIRVSFRLINSWRPLFHLRSIKTYISICGHFFKQNCVYSVFDGTMSRSAESAIVKVQNYSCCSQIPFGYAKDVIIALKAESTLGDDHQRMTGTPADMRQLVWPSKASWESECKLYWGTASEETSGGQTVKCSHQRQVDSEPETSQFQRTACPSI